VSGKRNMCLINKLMFASPPKCGCNESQPCWLWADKIEVQKREKEEYWDEYNEHQALVMAGRVTRPWTRPEPVVRSPRVDWDEDSETFARRKRRKISRRPTTAT